MELFDPYLEEFHLGGEFYRLFEHIPNVMFFAKDRKRRLFMGNQRFLEHCGFTSVDELVGKSDIEMFPKYMEDKFARDDKTILRSGKPLLNLVELFPSRDRLPEWYITNKYPKLFGSDWEGLWEIGNFAKFKKDSRTAQYQLDRYEKLSPWI